MRNKRCRGRVRSRGKKVLLPETRMVVLYHYAQSGAWQAWGFITEGFRKVLQLEADGDAERIVRMQDGKLRVVGWRRTRPTEKRRRSPTTLTRGTMAAVAGERTDPGAYAEVMKFKVWPLIGDTRAVCVRPRISDEERQFAERLLGNPR